MHSLPRSTLSPQPTYLHKPVDNPCGMVSANWAQSLVGRDWEIWWSDDDEDNDVKENQAEAEGGCTITSNDAVETSTNTDKAAETLHQIDVSMAIDIGGSVPPDIQLTNGSGGQEQDRKDSLSGDAIDSEGEGSIIDDWYAGRILSFTPDGGSFRFKIHFVGEENVYEMVLGQSKVRPSAWGWIKRTKRLLLCSALPSEDQLPADTSMDDDQEELDKLQNEISSKTYDRIRLPKQKGDLESPNVEELDQMLRLRYLLRAQIYLRSRLAKIENHAGSAKHIDGEQNPTETYVNHLVACCRDLEQLCDWFCQCWGLLASFFGEQSGSSQEADGIFKRQLTVDHIASKFYEAGKNIIMNALSIDLDSTISKRRQPISPSPQKGRQSKRRRLNDPGQNAGLYKISSNSVVERLLSAIKEKSTNSFLFSAGKMIHRVSSCILDPCLVWKQRACELLGEARLRDGKVLSTEFAAEEGAAQKKSEAGESDSEESKADERTFCNYADIQSALAAIAAGPVLQRLDWNPEKEKLEKKVQEIVEIELAARHSFSRIAEEQSHSDPGNDPILKSLRDIVEQAADPNGNLFNVNPIGKAMSPITREVLDDGIELRRWLLDVWHAEDARERICFVENIGERLKELPDLIEVPEVANNAHVQSTIAAAKSKARSLVEISLSPSTKEMASVVLWPPKQNPPIVTTAGVNEALAKLKTCPFILPVEEQLAIRLDVLLWGERAALLITLSNGTRVDFQQLETLSVDLQLILKGRPKTRVELLEDVYPNLSVEREMERFGSNDVLALHGQVVQTAASLHSIASQWRLRSQSIIDSLRMHGNKIAGQAISTQKSAPMVDLKRINDLTTEYKTLQVNVDTSIDVLIAVEREALKWNRGLYQRIMEEGMPLVDCLPFLLKERDLRPCGIIMDPTRHFLDSLVDVLTWYQSLKDAIGEAASEITALPVQDVSESTIHQKHSSLTVSVIYPLLTEGVEIVESHARTAGTASLAQVTSAQDSLRILEDFGFRRSAKAVNLGKIHFHPLGSSILSRMVGAGADEGQGFPLVLLGWYSWHLRVAELIASCEHVPNGEDGVKASRVAVISPSLRSARALLAKQPRLVSGSENEVAAGTVLRRTKTLEVAKLERLVLSAESAEDNMRKLLSLSKELLKAGMQEEQKVQEHLANLKQSYSALKTHSNSADCLSLEESFETPIDHHVKIFTWLVRTFPYPFLHLDEASYNDPVDQRVPWNILVSLNERLPDEPDAQVGAFALVSLRVRELYESGKNWQDEITRNTALTFRGGKRRAPGGNQQSDQDPDATSKLQTEKMKQLAEHPILSKVAMPRETAVSAILQSSTEFEIQLHDFLGKDYEGANPDRASFPDSNSLVGKQGEFVLYRLTGSPLFEELQARVHSLGSVAENVLAETPGKETFEWIMSAVSWIDSLSDAVSDDSPFKEGDPRLSLPSTEAKGILHQGEQIFLVLPDELKKTLSKHGIFVTTNKQDKTIKVTLKKDGAHHSCGGTVIRWCPVLFEALKADVRSLNNWEKALTKILAEFNAFFKASRESLKNDENLYTWFRFQEQVAELLEFGQESLVISPPKPFVTSFQNLLESLQKYLGEQSTSDKNQKFAVKWLAENSSTLNDRSILLNSLLYRKSMVETNPIISATEDTSGLIPNDSINRTFRDSCRSYIEKAFDKALRIAGVPSLPGVENAQDFCATKAWEIEDAMFERFQGEHGTSRISEDYRDKARSLRWSLEARNNVSLCFRILVGELDSEALIDMSSEDLSSQKAKMERAKAEQAAKSSALLTPALAPAQATIEKLVVDQSEVMKDGESLVESNASKETDSTINGSQSSSAEADSRRVVESLHAIRNMEMGESSDSEEASLGSPPSLKTIAKTVNSNRPPPPPSLLQSFQQPTETPYDPTFPGSRDRGRRFFNSNGGDKFRVEIVNLRLAFSAAFYLEDDALSGSNRFVPEVLSEKGRLKIEEFSRFMTDKLSGGRWAAIPLRLTVLSDQDMQQYKKFYKEYEVKRRIAMFSITQNTKVFLVTPKFHGAAKATGYISLPHKTSTYAIVLTKETFFID